MPKTKSPDAVISAVSVNGATVTVSTVGTRPAPSSKLTRYAVDYGDNSPLISGAGAPPKTLPPYTYQLSDTYEIWLYVWDKNDKTDEDSRSVDVVVTTPVPPDPTPIPPDPVPPDPGPTPPNPTPPSGVIQPSDLQFRGMWRYPIDDTDAHKLHLNPFPMTVRYVNGQRRILMVSLWGTEIVQEWTAPTTFGPSPGAASELSYVRGWANALIVPAYEANGWIFGGLWWDDAQQVLWYTIYPYYSSKVYPFLGATALHDDGSVTRYGLWAYGSTDLTSPQASAYKSVCKWLGVLPPSLSQAAGGRARYLGADMMSIGASANVGPGVIAVNFPKLTDDPQTVPVEVGVPLMAFNQALSGLATPAFYCRRDEDYEVLGHYDGPGSFSHSDTYGPFPGYTRYWMGSLDYVAGVALVETSKAGVLTFGRRATGKVWYGGNPAWFDAAMTTAAIDGSGMSGNSTGPHAERYEGVIHAFDPADLRAVATTNRQPWTVEPIARTDPNVPDFVRPDGTPDGGKVYTPGGGSATAVFDPIANQILWQLPLTWRPGSPAYPTIQIWDLPT